MNFSHKIIVQQLRTGKIGVKYLLIHAAYLLSIRADVFFMDTNLQELKKTVHTILGECLVVGLESGEITLAASEQSAYLIQRNMQAIDSLGELMLFLQDLCIKHPVYLKALLYVKGEMAKYKDQQKLEVLQAKLKSFTNLSSPHAS